MDSRVQVRQGLTVALCLVASTVAASCVAKGEGPGAPGVGTPANLVLPADIQATPPTSPARALLTWVAAVQIRDLKAVRRLTAPTAVPRVTPGDLDRAVLAIGATFARPLVLHSRIRGDVATLDVLLLAYAAGRTRPVLSVPATLRLSGNAAGWRVLDIGPLFPNRVPAPGPRGAAPGGSGKR